MRSRANLKLLVSKALPKGGRLALYLADAETLLLHITPAEDFEPDTSYAVVRSQWPEVKYGVAEVGHGRWEIKTASLHAKLILEPFHFKVEDQFGNVRFETAADPISFKGGKFSLTRKLTEGEALYGLGAHGETINRNPGCWRIWNRDEPSHHPLKQYYCTIPFGITHPGGAIPPHGFFLDNPGELHFHVGTDQPDTLRMEVHTGDLALWLFFEESPAAILEQYTQLTGRMERPPLWALGYQQCRWSYMTAERVQEVATEFRNRRIPCDVIYMDIDYMQDFRVFTWNSTTFSDPKALLGNLIEQGFSPLCIIDPGVAIQAGYFAYEDGLKQEGFFLRDQDHQLITERVWPGDVHMPDFTHPETRTTWGKWQKEYLLELGIAGVWNDMNEPAVFALKTPTRDFPSDALHHDFGRRRTHKQVHNIFGLTMAQASCEGQKEAYPNKRHFTLTRSGWAGIQRYSAIWSGDNASTWLSMRQDIAQNLNLGMSAVAFVGCDIGGFMANTTPELFARWIEWGVFQPFCRTHSCAGTRDQEPWSFGHAVEVVSRRMIELRYQLMPYIYTQMVECCESGIPMNRPLILEYPTDATVKAIGDQFLCGSDILVAPVLDPGVFQRLVYLPAGDWYHLWTRNKNEGGRWIICAAPYGQPPVFVRAGAVIPMHSIRQHLKEAEPEKTYLDIYPGPRLSGRLVEDDGNTLGYTKGEESLILFSGTETESQLELTIGAPTGAWISARKQWEIRLHRRDRAIKAVTCNGEKVAYEEGVGTITIEIVDHRKTQNIIVEYAS